MSGPRLPYGGRPHAPQSPGSPALELHALTVAYPGAAGLALSRVDLVVPAGSRVALVGANGSGKSTLLKTVAGLLRPHAGSIAIHGLPVGACHHRIAYLPQRSEIDWTFPVTLERLVLTGRYVHLGWLRRPGRRDRRVVAGALERLGLTALAGRQIGRLSGGQQQRGLLARALVQESDLLLLDEPLNAVDTQTREIVMRILDDLQAAGKTLVVATHDLDRLEADFDEAIRLEGGRRAEVQEAVWPG